MNLPDCVPRAGLRPRRRSRPAPGSPAAEESASSATGSTALLKDELTRALVSPGARPRARRLPPELRPRLVAAARREPLPRLPGPDDLDRRRLRPLLRGPHRDEYAGYARHGVEYLDRVMRDGPIGRLPLGPRRRTAGRPRARRREARLRHRVRPLRRQQGARGDPRRPRPEGRPRRLRLAGDTTPTTASTAATSRPSPATARRSSPMTRRPALEAGRPAGRLLRLQVDELAHPPAGGAGRVLPGRADPARRGAGCGRSTRSSATGSPPSRVP